MIALDGGGTKLGSRNFYALRLETLSLSDDGNMQGGHVFYPGLQPANR